MLAPGAQTVGQRSPWWERRRRLLVVGVCGLIVLSFSLGPVNGLFLGLLLLSTGLGAAYVACRPAWRRLWLERVWLVAVCATCFSGPPGLVVTLVLGSLPQPYILFWNIGAEELVLVLVLWLSGLGVPLAALGIVRRRGRLRDLGFLRYALVLVPLELLLFVGLPAAQPFVLFVLGGFVLALVGVAVFRFLRPLPDATVVDSTLTGLQGPSFSAYVR